MVQIKLSEARALCTAAELQVVQSSTKQSLAKMSAADLKKKIDQARKLRDKWHDLATRQRRDVQRKQGSRVTDEAARSQKKSTLFGEVLTRLETQFQKVSDSPGAAGASRPASSKPSKPKRAREHRQTRAEVREQLEEKRSKMDAASTSGSQPATSTAKKAKKATKEKAAPKKAAPKKAVAKKAAAETAGTSGTPKKAAKKKTATKAAAKPKVSAGRKAARKSKKTVKPADTSGSPPADTTRDNRSQQRSVKAAASQARVKASGLDTRTRGHVSARTKRTQSRRDARS